MTARQDVNPFDRAKQFFACAAVGADFFATASQRYVTEVDVDVGPDRLFAILDDEGSWPRWASPGIQRVEWTSPRPHGEGATRTVHMVGGLDVYERFFVWDVPRELAFYFVGATQEVWSSFAERYEVTEVAQGKSRLRWTVAYEPVANFRRVHFLVKPLMGLTFRRYLRKLQKYVRQRG
jgi:hypothetical protein